jgi:hypothetical protein
MGAGIMSRRIRIGVVVVVLTGSLGCAFFSPAAPHQPVKFGSAPSPHGPEPYPNWRMPPALDFDELSIAERERAVYAVKKTESAGGGTTGAEAATLTLPDVAGDVKFKVKLVPGDLDGVNNSPRKEMAAYLIQRLFLDPQDFVVPTTFAYCVEEEEWKREHGDQEEFNVEGLNCALVAVALWLKDVALPDPLYDEQRFLSDPTYAYFLSNFNVFTYVIGHRDGREGNFLVSKDDSCRQVFAIDNGSTFNPWGYNYFVPNWDVIRVAAVRKATVDRLRKLTRADLDFLLVVSQLEVGEDGVARQVPAGKSLDDDEGALRQGTTIQFGLTRKELDKVWGRIQELIAEVDSGKLPVF